MVQAIPAAVAGYRAAICQALMPFAPTRIAVVGSYARGEQRPSSDLDLLVQLGKRISLLQLVALEQSLSETIGIPVEILTVGGVKNPRLKASLEQDAVELLP